MTTWMVVEDEPDLYDMVLAMYEMMGVNGLAFADGEEAVAWIDEVESDSYRAEMPELILLDIRLPGKIGGLEVGARLRKSARLKNIPIILMTAYHMSPDDEQAALDACEADLLLYKPLPGYERLHDLFNQVIEKK